MIDLPVYLQILMVPIILYVLWRLKVNFYSWSTGDDKLMPEIKTIVRREDEGLFKWLAIDYTSK